MAFMPNRVPLKDMTAFAIAAMNELERDGKADFLLLKHDNLREWWTGHKAEEARKEAERLEKERIARVKEEALAKLSMEERQVLGLAPRKITVTSKGNILNSNRKQSSWDDEDEYITQWERDTTDDWEEV